MVMSSAIAIDADIGEPTKVDAGNSGWGELGSRISFCCEHSSFHNRDMYRPSTCKEDFDHGSKLRPRVRK